MKINMILILALAMATSCSADSLKTISFTVQAVDEDGLPVPDAIVSAGFYRFPGGGDSMVLAESVKATTDTNGFCTVEGRGAVDVTWEIGKEGFYRSFAPRFGEGTATTTNSETGIMHYQIVLRRIENPIPMYAKTPRGFYLPALNRPVGYDLAQGEWLPPHGKGEVADIVFHATCEFGELIPGNIHAYDATLTLTFSNDGDGLVDYVETQQGGSVFHLPRYAPETGYTNQWSLRQYEQQEGSSFKSTQRNEGMNQFFRVRTKKDKDGNIISAHYGKIRGGLWFDVASGKLWPMMKYYFNPNPNDRNMEFDPNQNLFTNLSQDEKVKDP